jgi:hypothetical protein
MTSDVTWSLERDTLGVIVTSDSLSLSDGVAHYEDKRITVS